MTPTCESKIIAVLTAAGIDCENISPGSTLWFEFCCARGIPSEEIAAFYIKLGEWLELESAARTAGLAASAVAAIKKDFFAGRLGLKEAAKRIHAESKQRPATSPTSI